MRKANKERAAQHGGGINWAHLDSVLHVRANLDGLWAEALNLLLGHPVFLRPEKLQKLPQSLLALLLVVVRKRIVPHIDVVEVAHVANRARKVCDLVAGDVESVEGGQVADCLGESGEFVR